MPKDNAYLEAQNKIAEALQSGATELPIHNQFTPSSPIENKGSYHD